MSKSKSTEKDSSSLQTEKLMFIKQKQKPFKNKMSHTKMTLDEIAHPVTGQDAAGETHVANIESLRKHQGAS